MAQSKGLSKKHSPLQKAHYLNYRTINKAKINLIKRLRTRVRRAEAKMKRRNRINAKRMKSPIGQPFRSHICHPDTGAIRALKKLGVKV